MTPKPTLWPTEGCCYDKLDPVNVNRFEMIGVRPTSQIGVSRLASVPRAMKHLAPMYQCGKKPMPRQRPKWPPDERSLQRFSLFGALWLTRETGTAVGPAAS